MEDEPPKEPTIRELRDRIVDLENWIRDLDAAFRRSVNLSREMDELLIHHCKRHDAQFADAWESIKALELTVFPNLARDIHRVHTIIGEGEPWRANQLDTREKLPFKQDKKKPPA